MLGIAWTLLDIITFSLFSPFGTYQNLGVPIRAVNRAVAGVPRRDILGKMLVEGLERYKYRLTIHNYSRIVDGEEIGAFDELEVSKKSIIIFNHVGGNDFVVNMQLLDYVNRLEDLRWVTLKAFENKITKPALDAVDALLLTQKPEQDKIEIEKYAEKYRDPASTFAISVFPEGGILDKDTYKRCKRVMDKYIHYTFENMCTPFVGAVSQLFDAFPEADIFDVNLKYFDRYGSGHASQGDYIGDRYSVINVALKARHPDEIFASIKKLERPATGTDMTKWMNNLWREKEKTLKKMRDPRIDEELRAAEEVSDTE